VRVIFLTGVLLTIGGMLGAAGFDQDPEALALRRRLESLPVVGVALKDDFNAPAERRLSGPIALLPRDREGQNAADQALLFPEENTAEMYVYYGIRLPRRAHLSLDFRVDTLPKDHHFLTMCSAGTAGNTKFMIRLGLDRRVRVHILTRREQINLESDPVALSCWHRLDWFYAPEGALLIVDGVIQDYSLDYSVPYAVETGEAFYLGDQPWWEAVSRKGVFYPLDNFVGRLDNLEVRKLGESAAP